MCLRCRTESGVALITALLVMALATIAAVAVLSEQNIDIRRTANLEQAQQAWWYALGAEQWAEVLLKRDRQTNAIDSLTDIWAKPVGHLPIDNGFLTVNISDLQGKFNLNDLAGHNAQAAAHIFARLLAQLPDVPPPRIPGLVQAVGDWVDPDINPHYPDGAEDDYYLGLTPAYRTANAPMASPSELLLVRGVTPAIYRALRPFVTTLPATATPINVNTAPAQVLLSLTANPDANAIADIVKTRAEHPFTSVQSFLAQPALAGRSVNGHLISVSSSYFLVHTEVHLGQTRLVLYSLLYRADGGDVRVIEHSKGAF